MIRIPILFCLFLAACGGVQPAGAAILAETPAGNKVTVPSLSVAATRADLAGSTVRVTSALSAAMSNISSATVHRWPADRKLVVEKGGSINNTTVFKFADGAAFEAGRHQAFAGSGRIAGLTTVTPEWWGAVADGVADSSTAIQKAVDAIGRATGSITRGEILFAKGTYVFGSQVNIDQQSVHVKGAGGTVFKWEGGTTAAVYPTAGYNTMSFFHVDDSSNCVFQDLIFLGKTTSMPTAAIHFDRTRTVGEIGTNEIHRVINCITGRLWTQSTDTANDLKHGVLVDGADGNNDTVYIDLCQFNDCTNYGVKFANTQSIWSKITNTVFNDCGTGVYAGCNLRLDSVYFNRNGVNDVVTVRRTQLLIHDMNSENSVESFNFTAGADVYISGSKITLSDGTDGSVAAGTYWLNASTVGSLTLDNLLVSKAATMTTTGLMAVNFTSADNTSLRIRNSRIPGLADKSSLPAVFPTLTKLTALDVDLTTCTDSASTPGSGVPITIRGVAPWADAYDVTEIDAGSALSRSSTSSITTVLVGDFIAGSYSKPLGGLLPKYSTNFQAPDTGRLQSVFCNKTVGAINPDSGIIKYKKFYPNELSLQRTFAAYAGPALALNAGSTTSHSVPGAKLGDFVLMSRAYTVTNVGSARWLTYAYVQVADTVGIRWQNEDPGANTSATTCDLNIAVVNPSVGLNAAADVTINALADNGVVTGTIAVPGANMGDIVLLALSVDAQGLILMGEVTSPNTVTYRIANELGAPATINSGSPVVIKALVIPIL